MNMKEKFIHYKKIILSTPFKLLILKIFMRFFNSVGYFYRYKNAIKMDRYLSDSSLFRKLNIRGDPGLCKKILSEKIIKSPFINSILRKPEIGFIISELSDKEKREIIEIADDVCQHRFDLLGSGKVKVAYGLDPQGLEGIFYNMKISSKVLKKVKKEINNKIADILGNTSTTANLSSVIDSKYEPIDWHIDFKTGYRWDKHLFCKKITYGDVPGADIKVPWELSRFQHLVLLGQAYLITGNEKYSLEYIYQIIDWVENNPPKFGINWKCTMDIAIRAANLILSLSFFRDSRLLTKEFIFYFLKSIYIHGEHIVNNLEYYSITSNHYLSDISGLIFIAEFFNGFAIGRKWKKFAIAEIKREMEKQVYDDGVDFEASTCYHRLALELFFFPMLYTVKNSSDFNGINSKEVCEYIYGDRYTENLYKMFEFVLFSLKPNGRLPQIGDNDNGRLFIFRKMGVLDARYLLALGAIFFQESKFKVDEFNFCSDALWVFGRQGNKTWDLLDTNYLRNIRSKAFSNAGWYIMRKDKDYMIVSGGPNGQNGNGGHAHNDKLSFELCINGRDILVDPGSYLYTPFPEWRNSFRSTSLHNTVLVDNKEQNEISEKNLFSMGNDAEVIINEWQSDEEYDFLEFEHHGYCRLEDPVIHKRQIFFNKKDSIWIIKDILKGNRRHIFNLHFHLGCKIEADVEQESKIVNISIDKEKVLKVIPIVKEDLDLHIERSWISKGYGEKSNTLVLKYSRNALSTIEFLFVLASKDFRYSLKNIKNFLETLREVES